jgi:hypothetical protein
MSRSAKIGVLGVLLAVCIGLVVFTAMEYLRSQPPTVNFAADHKAGQPVDLTVQTVGSIGFGTHPTWVSYLTRTPDGKWVHTTLWDVPAHTRVNVTVLQFDSGSPLRNQFFGLVRGTIGGKMTVNGVPTSLINSNAGNGVGHTFTITNLGINVPLYGVPSNAKNICGAAPCSVAKYVHNVIRFSFISPGPGQYPWQCNIPCGLGFLYGTGGPMQSIGYMVGFLKVVS